MEKSFLFMLKLSMCFQKKMNEQVILRTIVYSLLCFFWGKKISKKKSVNYFSWWKELNILFL